jgi:hypothetical protein
MLLDMLTADAAAKHGHEYSPPRAASPTNNASFLYMPLSILGSVLRGQTLSPSQATTPSHHADPTFDTSAPQNHAMKLAHDEPIASPINSRPVSSGSDVTHERPKKRNPRSKTCYSIARPVHRQHTKLHIRPKIILQLHQVIASQRPKPAYDIVPFSLLPQRSVRRIARTFNTRERLCSNDLLVAKAEEYNTKDDEDKAEEDHWGSREVIGVISPGKCEKGVTGPTEICLNDGMSRWEVSNMPNGGYEFNSTDEHGLTLKARWVLKTAHARRTSSMSMSTSTPLSPTGLEDKKFTFSTISSNCRRHPIIATMTHTSIQIMDNYSMPSANSPSTPGLYSPNPSPITPSSIDFTTFIDDLTEKLPIETDEALKRFILVSGVWVASKEFLTEHPTPILTPSATFRPPNHRTVSMSQLENTRSPSPASTVDEKRRSIPRMFKPSLERLPRRTSFTDNPPSPVSTRTTVNRSPAPMQKARSRRRANTVGTAQLHSVTGSVRKRYGLGLEDQTLVESPEEKQFKRSVELRRIKELAISSALERPSVETTRLSAEDTPRPPLALLPSPIVIPPSDDGPTSPLPQQASPLLSPTPQDPERTRKTQSAYNPITTTGMWDSGVTEGPGIKRRPTSMFVSNEKKRKQERKRERSKSKDGKAKQNEESSEPCEPKTTKKADWCKIKLKFKER